MEDVAAMKHVLDELNGKSGRRIVELEAENAFLKERLGGPEADYTVEFEKDKPVIKLKDVAPDVPKKPARLGRIQPTRYGRSRIQDE